MFIDCSICSSRDAYFCCSEDLRPCSAATHMRVEAHLSLRFVQSVRSCRLGRTKFWREPDTRMSRHLATQCGSVAWGDMSRSPARRGERALSTSRGPSEPETRTGACECLTITSPSHRVLRPLFLSWPCCVHMAHFQLGSFLIGLNSNCFPFC